MILHNLVVKRNYLGFPEVVFVGELRLTILAVESLEKAAKNPAEDHDVEVEHYYNTEPTADESPEFEAFIARYATRHRIGDGSVPGYECGARAQY